MAQRATGRANSRNTAVGLTFRLPSNHRAEAFTP
jgi:hypothetical protein